MHSAVELLVFGVIGCLFLFFLFQAYQSIPKKKRKKVQQEQFQQLPEILYNSIRRYKDHSRFQLQDYFVARASAKFYKIQLTLSSRSGPITLLAEIECEHELRFSLDSNEGQLKFVVHDPSYRYPSTDDLKIFLEPLSFMEKIEVEPGRITAYKTIPKDLSLQQFAGTWPSVMGTLIRFCRFLIDFDSRENIKVSGDALCPFCRSELSGSGIVSCKMCMTRHHAECWEETGRCSIFGCTGTTTLV